MLGRAKRQVQGLEVAAGQARGQHQGGQGGREDREGVHGCDTGV